MYMHKKYNSNDALSNFIQNASKHANATETGDYKAGNKYYNVIVKSINYLYRHDTLYLLFPCLEDPDIGVRMWSAYALLSIKEKECRHILEEIRDGDNGIHCVTAEYTLKEWEKGNLTFPWDWD